MLPNLQQGIVTQVDGKVTTNGFWLRGLSGKERQMCDPRFTFGDGWRTPVGVGFHEILMDWFK